MFQSLLWWIGRVNGWRGSVQTIRRRFNPCCGGLVASTRRSPTIATRAIQFQSLLWWIGRVNETPPHEIASATAMFQSLLWWIGRVNMSVDLAMHSVVTAFQSLLWWIGRVNLRASWHEYRMYRVSILVVVDWSRQHSSAHCGHIAWRCFNPCCGGLVASTLGPREPGNHVRGFNPCCGGLVASTPNIVRKLDRNAEVSILVVVDWSRQRRRRVIDAIRKVSILVVVDWSRQPTTSGPHGSWATFQSLLWWIGRVNSAACRSMDPRNRVSILVVVDWSRQPGFPVGSLTSDGDCFNPCCGGLVASTRRRHWFHRDEPRVSILVVVDWSRQRVDSIAAIAGRLMFQSLLWWIGRVNRRAGATEGCVRSFNPCCGGLVASTVPRVRQNLVHDGFNPCCGGLVASTSADAATGPAAGFQSLLWWIGRVNCGIGHPSPRPVAFQSLLWWIGRVNSRSGRPQPRDLPVSILVVVDWSRQLRPFLRVDCR